MNGSILQFSKILLHPLCLIFLLPLVRMSQSSIGVLVDELTLPYENILSYLKEFLEIFRGAQLPDHPHCGAREVLGIQRPQNTAHEYIVPLIDMDNLVVLVRILVNCIDLCPTWNLNLNPHVSLGHNIKYTKGALQNFFDDIFLIFLIFTLLIFFEKLGFN